MTLYSCILFWSMLNQIDPNITKAIIQVESSGNPKALSKDGKDGGLLQIRIKHVPYSKQQLLSSCTNVMVGTELLKRSKNAFPLYPSITYVSAHNLGIYGFKKIKHPELYPYYIKVKKEMNK